MSKKRYSTDVGGRPWTPEEDDALLAAILPCGSQAALLGACDRLAVQFGRGHRHTARGVNGNLVQRRLWGLVTTPDLYAGQQPLQDGPPTWAVLYCVQMAANCRKEEDGGKILPSYLARCIGRTPEETFALLEQHNPAAGIKGFGIA